MKQLQKKYRRDLSKQSRNINTDKSDALCLSKADKLGIDSLFVDPKNIQQTRTRRGNNKTPENYGTDLVVACGYMRLLSPFL